MNTKLGTAFAFQWSFIVSSLALLSGIGMSFFLSLPPCHLCVIQRIFYAAIMLTSLGGLTKKAPRIWLVLSVFFAVLGGLTAARQSWLQHLPVGEAPACLPPWSHLFQLFSPLEAVLEVFKGSGECALVDWSWLGLSLAEYSLFIFLIIIIINIFNLFSVYRVKKLN